MDKLAALTIVTTEPQPSSLSSTCRCASSGYGSNESSETRSNGFGDSSPPFATQCDDVEEASDTFNVSHKSSTESGYHMQRQPLKHTISLDERPDLSLASSSGDLIMVRNDSSPLKLHLLGQLDSTRNIFKQYLRSVCCDELAPAHGNLVALDSNIAIDRVLPIILNAEPKECRALVWVGHEDRVSGHYSGVVTLTDLLHGLQTTSSRLEELYKKPVAHTLQLSGLIRASAVASLADAIDLLRINRIHRVAIWDGAGIICWIGWKRVLRCINGQLRVANRWKLIGQPIEECRVGMWHADRIKTVTYATELHAVIDLLVEEKLTALPIIEPDSKKMLDAISKRDIALALYKSTKRVGEEKYGATQWSSRMRAALKTNIGDLLALSDRPPVSTWTCTSTTPLKAIVQRLVDVEHKCTFIIDDDGRCIATVSVSDIVKRLLADSEETCGPSVDVRRRQRYSSETAPDTPTPFNIYSRPRFSFTSGDQPFKSCIIGGALRNRRLTGSTTQHSSARQRYECHAEEEHMET